MALDNMKLDIVNESSKKAQKTDNDTLDIFDKQESSDSKPELNDDKKESDTSKLIPLAGPGGNVDGFISPNGGSGPINNNEILHTHDDKPHIFNIDGHALHDQTEPGMHDEGVGTGDDDLAPRFGVESPVPSAIIDVNTYQQKKNLAQGMMDLALLSANANQLRYVIETGFQHPYFYPSLVFISCSVIFQIAVGVGLIMNSRYDVNDKEEICKADKINNFTVLGIFLITVVNVFITAFSVASAPIIVQAGEVAVQQAG